ncbi:MAG: pseudouridine synthase [Candidatus Eremiobacter antarcticus]|nr:rRNA pseudouridine synthase [Candidatus Eremiobacteraeota bacterium]MBC5807417.1 rRNA pseudouridine synthase [Candidatus Eremiobacteraeota bacterium]PZR63202.1 MAG: pseudouridine synthase [Candidatus Eremiobacter sp. RRmetagenome_bin22]
MKVRLNKLLADAGVASRRASDKLIESGKVFIDGRRASVGALADPQTQRVTVNGRRIGQRDSRNHITIVLNKPAGVITTLSDEHGRPSVEQYLPKQQRLFPIGRLDADTTGVLLCTTDGGLARFLTNAANGVAKHYEVTARGKLEPPSISALGARNIRALADGSIQFTIVLTEGKNRQVRRMCASQGLRIVSLARTRFGPVELGDLKTGSTRALKPHEERELNELRAKA